MHTCWSSFGCLRTAGVRGGSLRRGPRGSAPGWRNFFIQVDIASWKCALEIRILNKTRFLDLTEFWWLMTVLVVFWRFGQLPKAVLWTLRYHCFWSHSSGTNFIENLYTVSSSFLSFIRLRISLIPTEIFQSDSDNTTLRFIQAIDLYPDSNSK